jgi:hypothetical protein
VPKRKKQSSVLDPGEISKGQLHVKCLHESGDEDQRHRRIDIGSLNKGKTGGDGCHRMSFDRRLLKSDWLRRIDPIPRSRTWSVKSDPVTHSPHYLPLQRECSKRPTLESGTRAPANFDGVHWLVSLTATKFRFLARVSTICWW